MADRIQQRWRRPGRVRGALAGMTVGGLMLGMVPASPAAATGPTEYLQSICSAEAPYAVLGRIGGFPPSDLISILLVVTRPAGTSVSYSAVSTDGDGNGFLGLADRERDPFRVGALYFHDRDSSRTYTRGDDVVANLVATVDQPCTSVVAHPK